ncbi:two-component system CheB/CheR fusion protein [Rhodopirellula rubra]|uniref:histidine kinase n=1 Tax=Aporhodopirellula rubra TaxID=980271 RepID=A0A7W5H887_9BACT|nr:CheR family methyltransferase [Aporhodopirellula rubra]MBB3209228.1 two-component system CheB/CheR fusion protein [Aporhodopirellula rubra]
MSASDNQSPLQIVGVGCSSAGLGDFLDVLRGLDGRLPQAIVLVVSETEPSEKSVLQQIENRCHFPISEVTDSVTLAPGRIYVASAKTNLELDGDKVVAHPWTGDNPHSPVDHLFTSIASQAKRNSVGVILSGAGTDGTLGLREISEAGGTTIVQSSKTASEPSMPESAESLGVVDYVLSTKEISSELLQLAERSDDDHNADNADLTEQIIAAIPLITAAIDKHTDNDFKHYNTTTLVRRIRRRISVLKIENVDSYLELLQSSREEAAKLFRELLISVTEFFRDAESFEALASSVLAKCIDERSAQAADDNDDPLRIWVAGCATGEEAYTVAILLLEQMKRIGKTIPVQIFATDLDDRALQVARAGAYPIGISDQVSDQRLNDYFHKRANQYFVNKEVRKLVVFSAHNLISDPPFTKQDLILCRNLLIYLGTHLQRKLIPLFHYALKPTGHLFLGPSESMSSHKELFAAIDVKHRIYQRKSTAISGPSVNEMPALSLGRYSSPTHESETEVDLFQYGQRIMLDEFAPQWAIIDDEGRIQTLSADTSAFLQLTAGDFENNIIKLAHSGLKLGLRAAFSEAKKHRRRVVSENLSIPVDGGLQRVNITVQPMPEAGNGTSMHFVVFQKAGEPMHRDDAVDADCGISGISQAKAGSLIDHLESELAATRNDLERTVQELETANEELKSSNEELLSMNEELQSANEELNTSKEELQASNETLARSNSDLENLFRSSNTATLFLDKSNCIRNFTPAMSAIYNVREVDLGRPLVELTSKAVAMSALPTMEQLAADPAAGNETIETTDGRWFIRRVFPYKSATKEADGLILTFSDVTELRVGQQRLEMALKGGDLGAWDLDLVANQSWRSPRHDSIFGYAEPLASWGMDSFLKHVHEDDRGWIQDFLESTSDQQHWDYACRIRRPDGEVRWIETHATTLFNDAGEAVRMFGTVADITNRRRDEAKLAALAQQAIDSSAKARAFFDHSRYYAGVLTLDGVLTDVNQTATKMCGYERANEIGKPFWETSWWRDLPDMQAEVKDAVAGAARGEDFTKNMNFRIADGSVRITEFVLSPIRDDDGDVVFVLATGQDITDKVKFQEELQRLRQLADAANQAKSDFLANMSHEIRSPMTAILGFAELLEVESADAKEKVETIRRNGQFLLELINDILDLSKIEAGKIELDPVTFSPAKLLEDVSSLMSVRAVDSGLDLSVTYSGNLPSSLRSDPIRLRQVLINLTGNAIKFTDSGTVKLTMSYDERSCELRYTITDTGIGMTPEQQRKLFRPFSQADSSILREYGGSGLGLAISQRLSELLGGRIEVTSELGKGSSFTLVIPCEMTSAEPETADPVPSRNGNGRLDAPLDSGPLNIRVLVVDDRRDIRFLSQHFVKQLGGEVITAENGIEALEAVETEQAAGRKIDVVLMDVQMPKMDGFTAVRTLRSQGFDKPIIALTANAMDSDRDACFEAGYTDYLSKPIDAKKLTEALRRHCGS